MDAAARHLEATKALLCSLDASVARSVFAEEGPRGGEGGTRGDDEPARRIQCCFRGWRARREADRRRLASFLQEEERARQRREAFVRDTMDLLDTQSQERALVDFRLLGEEEDALRNRAAFRIALWIQHWYYRGRARPLRRAPMASPAGAPPPPPPAPAAAPLAPPPMSEGDPRFFQLSDSSEDGSEGDAGP